MAQSVPSAPHVHGEEVAYACVEPRIWPNGPVCPHCGSCKRIGKMICASKKGSSSQIYRALGVTLEIAWFMSHRLRGAPTAVGMEPMDGENATVENR